MKQVQTFTKGSFTAFAKFCIPNKTIVGEKMTNHGMILKSEDIQGKETEIRKKPLKSGNPNDWNKYKYYETR